MLKVNLKLTFFLHDEHPLTRLTYMQHEQGGSIGIVVDCFMYEPLTDNDFDQEAANRILAFIIGWYIRIRT